jgi:hypothetical protein
MSNGNFSSLSIGDGYIINKFNADGSYNIEGNGTFGTILATQFNGSEYIINSGNNNGKQLGIMYGGIGRLTGLTIDQINKNTFPGATGNLTFTGNYLTQGIVFADNSFLNSVKNLDILTNDVASFKSINLTGNIIGNNSNAIFNNINCSNSGNFNSLNSNIINTTNITGNNAYFTNLNISTEYNVPSITTDSATINSINGNNINNIQNIKFEDGTIQYTASGTIMTSIISNKWIASNNITDVTLNTNAPLYLKSGKWIVSLYIVFTNGTPSNNYVIVTCKTTINEVETTKNLYQYGLVLLAETNNSMCSGTFIYNQPTETILNLVPIISSDVNINSSYFTAMRIA